MDLKEDEEGKGFTLEPKSSEVNEEEEEEAFSVLPSIVSPKPLLT